MANQIDIIATSLEALIQRATNPTNQGPDTAAIDAFCGLVNREPDCAQTAAKLITSKVHSLQEWEALQALLVLENCMKRCTTPFLSEVGKFRFLNELIKLVSPKYLGAHTPESVRRRVLELMHSWTLSYPKEVKIREAYDMLKKQGVVKDDPVVAQQREPIAMKQQPACSILQDEEKSQLLQKLLQSKNPQDLQAANRLIKSMVKEEERRNEEKWRSHNELETVVNNCRLLGEMLDSYQEGVTSEQELELIKELYNTCQNLRPALFKLANTNADPGFCHEVLTVNDELGEVFARYNAVVKGPSGSTLPSSKSQLLQPKPDQPSSSLLDLSPSPTESKPSLSKDLTGLGVDLSETESSAVDHSTENTADILKAVFNDSLLPQPMPQSFILDQPPVMNTLSSHPSTSIPNLLSQTPPQNEPPPKPKGLEELDALSKMLMEQTLSATSVSETISSLRNSSSSLTPEPDNPPENPLDDDLILNLGSWSASDRKDIPSVAGDASEPVETLSLEDSVNGGSTPVCNKKVVQNVKEDKPVLPLGDVSIALEAIKPSGVPPFVGLDEKNGISTVIHLAKDTPRPDVAVFVVTTSSKSESSLTNFLFQPIVPKFCRLRLLTPSSTSLPPHNPFLPPSAITQVMLIASPTKEPIHLKFVISYTMDEETITEMGDIDVLLMKAE